MPISKTPQSAKNKPFAKRAFAIEDEYLSKLGDDRVKKNEGFISHEEFWNSVKG